MINRKMAFVGVVLCLGAAVSAAPQLDKILKGGAVMFAVDKFGPDINKAINSLTKTNNVGTEYDTKVVPVLSVGTGAYAGAVQVAGPRLAVKKVKAVAQIEGKFNPLGLRFRALIPISSKSVSDIKRVPGVGVSGILDVKL